MNLQSLFLSRIGAVLFPAIIVMSGIAMAYGLEKNLVATRQAEEVAVATREVLAISDELKRKTVFHNMLAETIADAVSLNPNLNQQSFSEIVRPFLQTNPSIMNVALAKGLVVEFVYPFDANRSVIGLDYAQVPDQLTSIAQMSATRASVFSGPVDLVQGQRGYIHRAPIYVGDEFFPETFWGLVSVVTSETELLSVANSVVNQKYDFVASRMADGEVQKELLWGNPHVLDANPVREQIEIGDQIWEISVAPRNGWSTGSESRWLIAALTTLSVIAMTLLFVSARRLFFSRIKSWEQLAEAIEVIDDGFALYGPDDRLIMCNSRYKDFYAASAHLMEPGRKFEEIIRGGVANGQYADAVGNEEAWIEQRLYRHQNPDGPVEQLLDNGRWLKIYESKMTDGSTVGFRVDVTELKEAKTSAERASAAKTEFLNTVSHEIRTPLSAIIGYTSVLRNLRVMPEYRRIAEMIREGVPKDDFLGDLAKLDQLVSGYANRIDANGVHLLNIIDDILYWSNGERLSHNSDRSPVELKSLLNAVKDQLSGMAFDAGIDLDIQANPASVLGDEMRLTQVFVNLVGNAIKFTQKGWVKVRVSKDEGLVIITVEDTGPGIPESEYDNIFASFTQLDHGDTRMHGGCGLGLAISKDIVTKLGGEITVSSTLGAGSTFTVILPSLEAEVGDDRRVA